MNTRRRAKLNALKADRQWDDEGTGHVSSCFVDRLKNKSHLESDSSMLLRSRSKPDTANRTQENKTIKRTKRIINKIDSKKLGHDNREKPQNNGDVYEFTFDPNEEPPPQKKKRKKPINKNKPKPKTVIFNNNYQRNVFKTLESLKNIVSKKSAGTVISNQCVKGAKISHVTASNVPLPITQTNPAIPPVMQTKLPTLPEDIEPDLLPENEINYSPVNSPAHCKSPVLTPKNANLRSNHGMSTPKDPLNLNDDFSFFDDIPVANSSLNSSIRHPSASPWRVEFQNLPIKWQANTYVKPNMTPALESSFINNFDEPKKKHVYTNMIPLANEPLPEVQSTPKLVQPSIISFIKEMAEKTANKHRKARSATPNTFDIITSESKQKSPKKLETPMKGTINEAVTPKKNTSMINVSNSSKDASEKENSKETRTRKNFCENKISSKTPEKEKDADNTFFGFDDSENQENELPVKKIDKKVKALRPRARAVLQEINNLRGPMRAVLPAKTKFAPSSETVNKLYEEIKSAADAPTFPDRAVDKDAQNLNVDPPPDDDDQSVHLFEDIDVVHHVKASRKSYGKSRKVMFRQHSVNESETNSSPQQSDREDSSEDDLADLTFKMPTVKTKRTRKKKLTNKQKVSKKEEAEVEAWAKNFNSMCEDVDEFTLVVE